MIKRRIQKTDIGSGMVRYRVVVTGEECPPRTHESRIHLSLFIKWLADNQTLLECGFCPPDWFKVSHNGECWEAVAEAEMEESQS